MIPRDDSNPQRLPAGGEENELIFVSYAGADKDVAEWIAYEIEETGRRVIIQCWDFNFHQSFVTQIDKALASSARVLAVLSKRYFESAYCRAEWETAYKSDADGEKGSLLVARIDKFNPISIIQRYPREDIFGAPEDELRTRLRRLLQRGRRKPARHPVLPGGLATGPISQLPPAQRLRVAFPDRLCVPPLPPNKHLTARDPELAALEDAVAHHRDHDAPLAIVLTGQGGTGKTQIAINYAHKLVGTYVPIYFINAETRDALQNGIAALADIVRGSPSKNGAGGSSLRYKQVLNWLKENGGWLLVFENIDDLTAAREVRGILPLHRDGLVLITARYNLWNDQRYKRIFLDCFSEKDAARYLHLRVTHNAGTDNDARQLSATLGHLPLALEQAAACICRLKLTFVDFRAQILKGTPLLGSEEIEAETRYELAADATWQKQRPHLSKLALEILTLCSLYSPEYIPRELLTASDSVDDLKRVQREAALAELAALSLIQLSTIDVTIHRLIHSPVRSSIPKKQVRRWVRKALRQLATYMKTFAFSWAYASWKRWGSLLPHARKLLDTAWEMELIEQPFPHIAHEAANYLWVCGDYNEAEVLHWRAINALKKLPSTQAGQIARPYRGLGRCHRARNQFAEAEKYFRRALAFEKKLEPDNPNNRGSTLRAIGDTRCDQGYYANGEKWFRKALQLHKRARPRVSHEIASSTSSLAGAVREQGRYLESRQLMEEALRIREEAAERNPPGLARAKGNLSKVLRFLGCFDQALQLAREALAIQEANHSTDHPDIARSLGHVAMALYDLGRFDEAKPLAGRALEIRARVFGEDHAGTATAHNNLARLLHATGDLDGANVEFLKARKSCKKSLREDHNNHAIILGCHGLCLCDSRRFADAARLLRQALVVREKQLPKSHPYCGMSQYQLGHALTVIGEFRRARTHLISGIKILIQAPEFDRSHLALAHWRLSQWYIACGKVDGALREGNEALAIMVKAKGAKHPDAIAIRKWLGDLPRRSASSLPSSAIQSPETSRPSPGNKRADVKECSPTGRR